MFTWTSCSFWVFFFLRRSRRTTCLRWRRPWWLSVLTGCSRRPAKSSSRTVPSKLTGAWSVLCLVIYFVKGMIHPKIPSFFRMLQYNVLWTRKLSGNGGDEILTVMIMDYRFWGNCSFNQTTSRMHCFDRFGRIFWDYGGFNDMKRLIYIYIFFFPKIKGTKTPEQEQSKAEHPPKVLIKAYKTWVLFFWTHLWNGWRHVRSVNIPLTVQRLSCLPPSPFVVHCSLQWTTQVAVQSSPLSSLLCLRSRGILRSKWGRGKGKMQQVPFLSMKKNPLIKIAGSR